MYLSRWEYLFCISIVVLPFIDSFDLLAFFAPLRTLSFLVLLVGVFLWGCAKFLEKGKVKLLPRSEFVWLVLFVMAVVISGVVNFPEIMNNKFQGNFGFNRYFLSLALLLANVTIVVFVHNVLISGVDKLRLINQCLMISFLITTIYGVIEILSILQQPIASEIVKNIDAFFRGDNDYIVGVRVRGLAKEPSNFGIYLSVVFPWIVSYYYKKKGAILDAVSLLMLIMLVVLALLSISRTTYIIMVLEFGVFLVLHKNYILSNMRKNSILLLILFTVAFALMLYMPEDVMKIDFFSTIETVADFQGSMSNIARYSSQVAALYIFIDNPLFGVGYDQFAIHAPAYYPCWGYVSNEVVDWATNYTKGNTWPPAYNVFCRLLAETGLVGTLTFIGFLVVILKKSFEKVKLHDEKKRLFRCLQISMIGVTLSGINGSEISSVMWLIYAILIGETTRYARKDG